MKELKFLCWKKNFYKIETKNNIFVKVLYHENKLTFPIYVLEQKFEISMDLLLEYKSYYVYIKDFGRFMFYKTKNKNKSYFFRSICAELWKIEQLVIMVKKLNSNITRKTWMIIMIIIWKRMFVISWCFWKIYWHFFKILQTRSLSLFQFSWIKLEFDAKNDCCEIKKKLFLLILIYWKRIKRKSFIHL